MKIKLGISNRHIHLNEEDYELLFGKEEMKVKNKLSQTGQYASNLTVDIKTEKKHHKKCSSNWTNSNLYTT